VLINVTGGADLTLHEVTDAANVIAEVVDPGANIIFGAVIHPRYQKELRVTVIATGLRSGPAERGVRPVARGGRDVPPPGRRDPRRDDASILYDDERPRRDAPAPRTDDRDEQRGNWRRRPSGSPLGEGDDDIDLRRSCAAAARIAAATARSFVTIP